MQVLLGLPRLCGPHGAPLSRPLLKQPVVLANSHPNGLDSFVADREGMWIRRAEPTHLVIEVAPLKEAMA